MKQIFSGKLRLVAFGSIMLLLLAACTSRHHGGTASVASPDFFGLSDYLARQLVARSSTQVEGQRVILASMVNLDDLQETNSFGRLLTESLATSLFQYGLKVAEVRKGPSLLVKKGSGEFYLSRDATRLAASQKVQAIVTGTYSLTPSTVILNLRMLEAGSEEVLSVAGMEVQRSHNINYLLAGKNQVYEGRLSGQER